MDCFLEEKQYSVMVDAEGIFKGRIIYSGGSADSRFGAGEKPEQRIIHRQKEDSI